MPAKINAKTIDEYLAALSDEQRIALEQLRKAIRAAAPAKREECISYSLPAFRQDGMLVAFGAAAKHCTFYLMSATTVGLSTPLCSREVRHEQGHDSLSCG